jgi:ribosomal protein S8
MIERKLLMLQNGQIAHHRGENFLEVPYEKWKDLAVTNMKKHGYVGLVATIRFYMRSTKFLKSKFEEIKIKIKNIRGKKLIDEEKREVSGFLKMISEYKEKIREIKYKIKEEENL